MLSFIATCLVLESTPGPNMAYLAMVGATQGRKAALSMVAGIAIGLLVVGIAASLGAAALVAQSPAIYQFLRWAGVAYLFFLAAQAWRGVKKTEIAEPGFDPRFFRHGLITDILNPKAALFYITVLPSFIEPHNPALPQSLSLTVGYVVTATLVHVLIAVGAAHVYGFLDDPSKTKTLNRVFAVLLALIALWFGWASRMP